MCSALSYTRPFKFDIFGDLRSISNLQDYGISVNDATFENELEYYYNSCGSCVVAPENMDITGPQKDLLLWHWKLGVSMYHIQELIIDHI